VRSLSGTIIVSHLGIKSGPTGCVLPAPNQALAQGFPVPVLDEDRVPLATGHVVSSTMVDDGVCRLAYLVLQIPYAAEYLVIVGDVMLPSISYRLLERTGWNLEIRLTDFQEEARTVFPSFVPGVGGLA